MGVQHTNETETGGLSVDIEVDAQDTRRELGSTVFKRRLLAAQGLRCIMQRAVFRVGSSSNSEAEGGVSLFEASVDGASC